MGKGAWLAGKATEIALLTHLDPTKIPAVLAAGGGGLVTWLLERKDPDNPPTSAFNEVVDAAIRELDMAARDVFFSDAERESLRDALLPLLDDDAFDAETVVAVDYDAETVAETLLSKHPRVVAALPGRRDELRRLAVAAIKGALSSPEHLRRAEEFYRRVTLSALRTMPRDVSAWSAVSKNYCSRRARMIT